MTNISSRHKNLPPLEPSCKKTIYHSREEAQDMIKYIKESRVVREIRAYKCDACGFWHLTSSTQRRGMF